MGKVFREWIKAAVEAVLIIFILYFIFWPMKIEGSSMESTFFSGDKIFISKIPVFLSKLSRSDIIVFSSKNKKIIKRIIGLPGDHIEIKDDFVKVNEQELIEPYVQGITEGFIDLIVPEKSIFVLGDNRENSIDSRNLGCISYTEILGKVLFRWFPL